MQDSVAIDSSYRVLHAIVGHKFPVYFTNAVSSVLFMTEDDVLVVDNASNLPELTRALQSIANKVPRVRLLMRDSNDISRNSKVGGLYDAYNEVMSYALQEGYDYLHIMQNDMQMLWWDESVMRRARDIYAEYPECVNIRMLAHPAYTLYLSDSLEYLKPNLAILRKYGLTDTGLYDLAKWRQIEMKFLDSEVEHGQKYLDQGIRVFIHPLPSVAFIPWPAVVRNGHVKGREPWASWQFLLQPLNSGQISQIKEAAEPLPIEELAIPWGWTCLTPYWSTDLRTIDYWVFLYRDIRARGLRAARPRWERRGLAAGIRVRQVQRRPRFWLMAIIFQPIWYSARRTLTTWLAALRSR